MAQRLWPRLSDLLESIVERNGIFYHCPDEQLRNSPLPVFIPFLKRQFLGMTGELVRRMLQPEGWFYLFLFCQIECGFILGTCSAKRLWFGLAISREWSLPIFSIPGCRILTWGWTSIWSDQNAKLVYLPLGQAMEIPKLTLPKNNNNNNKTTNLVMHRMTKFLLVVLKKKKTTAIRAN